MIFPRKVIGFWLHSWCIWSISLRVSLKFMSHWEPNKSRKIPPHLLRG
jgi:hypothetical protein